MKDCSCGTCVKACETTPGWFAPKEAENAAKVLGIDWAEFRKQLIVDYWVSTTGPDILAYSPRKIGVDDGKYLASWSWAFTAAKCVFLKDGKCSIHAVKPYECRHAMPCEGSQGLRLQIADKWKQAGNPLRRE